MATLKSFINSGSDTLGKAALDRARSAGWSESKIIDAIRSEGLSVGTEAAKSLNIPEGRMPASPSAPSTGKTPAPSPNVDSAFSTIPGALTNSGLQVLTDLGNKYADNESIGGLVVGAIADTARNQVNTASSITYNDAFIASLGRYQQGLETLKSGNAMQLMSAEGQIQKDLQADQLAAQRYGYDKQANAQIRSAELEFEGTREQAAAQRYGYEQQAGAQRYSADMGLRGTEVQAAAQRYGYEQQAGAQRYSAELGLKGTETQAAAQRYGYDKQAEASRYGADRGLEGTRLQADAQRFGYEKQAEASRYGADRGLEGTLAQANAQRFGYEKQAEASKYGADRGLEGTRLQADAQRYGYEQQAGAQRYSAELGLKGTETQAAAQRYGYEQQAGAQRYSADVEFKGTQVQAEAQRYGYEKQAEASKYGADRGLEGTKYQSDSAERQIGLTGAEQRKTLGAQTEQQLALRRDARGAIARAGQRFYG